MRRFSKNNLLMTIGLILFYILIQSLLSMGILDTYMELNIILICINIILAVGLNLITGFTGQFSLGHAAFMSIGAYTSAILTAKLGQPFFLGIILSGITAALAGVLIGIPTLRLKGDYLAIATLGFGEIIKILALNTDYIGGAIGFNDIPQYTNWTWAFGMTVLAVVFIKNFLGSYKGRACIAIREDEIAAEAMGVNATYYKVLAFAIGAFFAGIAGSLYANYFYFIKPDTFDFMKSIDILVIVVFGGLGSIAGSIVGTIVLSLLSTLLQSVSDLRMIIYALILFGIMLFKPAGLMGNEELKIFKFKVFKKEVNANDSVKGY